ncbi:MAG: metallopeptidase TldD-related protein [Candidatus Wallbacteria bacterium]|nr:metallopeptidase TldD-related protein [Candidatus Wallbacteria bacterium]
MIDRIRKILDRQKGIKYLLSESRVESRELFFVKKALDLKRCKDVTHLSATLYRDFVEKGVSYLGSATIDLFPTMTEAEISKAAESAAFAAGFVKNPVYPLVKPCTVKSQIHPDYDPDQLLPKLIQGIYELDIHKDGGINSAELFLNKVCRRLVNSDGLDVSHDQTAAQLEFIVSWKGPGGEIELYRDLHFSPGRVSFMHSEIGKMLDCAKDRAKARPTPSGLKCPVLFSGKSAAKLFGYYHYQASAAAIYQKISRFKIGDRIQGEHVNGDLINLSLPPFLPNSVYSLPYDQDGFPLKEIEILRDGNLMRHWGSLRYCHYLGIEPTGVIYNMEVAGGKNDLATLRQEPHLEASIFSDFELDEQTGDFGGELRLGWYFDGKNRIPVSGGSITGNLLECQQKMYLSREIQAENRFQGPEAVKVFNISISG